MGQRKPTKGAAHFSISEKKEGCAAEIKTKNPNLNKERAIFHFTPHCVLQLLTRTFYETLQFYLSSIL